MSNLIKPILEASYLNQAEAQERMKQYGFTYDNELSNNLNKVFIDANGNPHIAFRGSKRVEDFLIHDPLAVIGLDKFSSRFQDAKKLVGDVERKYGKGANVYGNSLGGRLAETSGAHGNIVTHNKLTGLADIGKTLPSNQTDIRTSNDIPSLLANTQRHNGEIISLPSQYNLVYGHLPESIPNNFSI